MARSILETEARTISEFFGGMRGTVHVALEEGTQAQWLYDLLTPQVDRVVVCDRRGEKRWGNKGDRVDADDLSAQLSRGQLRAVYHGNRHHADLKELTRAYRSVVEDRTRMMLRLKALFRARAVRAPGTSIYHPRDRARWLIQLRERGACMRAEGPYSQLDLLRTQHKQAKTAMVTEARKDPTWAVLDSVPFFGPVRISLLITTIGTPWRFRTKRNLWAYAGLAVITSSSADYEIVDGRVRRRTRRPLTRGLNRNYNRVLKGIFKGAATAASSRPGPFKDFYEAMLKRGMRPELARVTLARKIASLTLRIWKTGELVDPTQLTEQQAR